MHFLKVMAPLVPGQKEGLSLALHPLPPVSPSQGKGHSGFKDKTSSRSSKTLKKSRLPTCSNPLCTFLIITENCRKRSGCLTVGFRDTL